MVTDDLLVPVCPPWCDGQHATFLSLSDAPDTAWVVTHSRTLADLDGVAGVEVVQDEPHPAMRIEDGHADPSDFTVGPRLVLWGGDDQATVRAGVLRSMAAALAEAAVAAESWGLR